MARVNLMLSKVGHERHRPKKNRFLYKVFYVETPVLSKGEPDSPKLFSFNRFNLLSQYTKDEGRKDKTTSWRTFVEEEFAAAKLKLPKDWDVHLISHPRVLGYQFNPISYWMVTDGGKLKAVICEVHNTFKQNHNYLLAHKDLREIKPDDILTTKKALYVSPFNLMPGYYEFRTSYAPGKTFKSDILYYEEEGEITVTTYMGGTIRPLTSGAALGAVVRYPFMTLLVVFRIHWQALILVIKRVPLTLKIRPRKEYESGETTKGDQL